MAGFLFLHATLAIGAAPEDTLGTLFYSPAERIAITRQRSGNSPAVETSAPTFAVSGLVKRAQGKGAMWINGREIREGESLAATGKPPAISAGNVMIEGRALRVGEGIDLTTGERSDIVPQDAVSVKRPE